MTRSLLCLTALLLAGAVFAQENRWTVQTAAFQDYRQASAQVTQLRDLGFDAYTEFAMSDGQQYARVRVGCFTDRSAADAFADALRRGVTAEAVAQPMSEGTTSEACVEWNVGFLKPRTWALERREPDVLFRVEVGGAVGYLRHDGARWQFSQAAPAPVEPLSGQTSSFRALRVGGVRFVQARLPGSAPVNACLGELLWQSGTVAVVERSDSVIACVVDDYEDAGPS